MPGTAVITIGENQWAVDVAASASELAAGLGGIESIPAGTGMLFDLGFPQVVEVTTEPMLFNIDIIFISEGLQVVDVEQNIAPGYLVTEQTPVRYFLEVNAGEAEGIEVGDSVVITDYQYSPPSSISQWMPTIVGIAALGFVGAMVGGMASIMFTSDAARSKKYLPEGARYTKTGMMLPKTEAGLAAKWFEEGLKAGKTDGWMDVENTIKETAQDYPKIKDAHELVWTDIDLWEQTDHFNILYGSKMWEDARGDIDVYSDLRSEFWEGYLTGRREIGKDIYKIAKELVKSSSMELLPQTVGHRGKVSYMPKRLGFATESKEVLTRTVRNWLRKGKAHSIQNAGYYGVEGFKPRLFAIDGTIYQVDWGVYRTRLLPASESDLAEGTKRRLREKGIEIGVSYQASTTKLTKYDVSVDSWVAR